MKDNTKVKDQISFILNGKPIVPDSNSNQQDRVGSELDKTEENIHNSKQTPTLPSG